MPPTDRSIPPVNTTIVCPVANHREYENSDGDKPERRQLEHCRLQVCIDGKKHAANTHGAIAITVGSFIVRKREWR